MGNRIFFWGAGLVGIPALAGTIVGAFLDWDAFAQSWLFALIFWIAFPLGALPALFAFDLTGGGWGETAAPALKAMAATLPLLLIGFIPLLFAFDALFPWSAPPGILPEVVRKKTLYLNVPFFIVRSCIYAAIWLSLLWVALHSTGRHAGRAAAGAILWLVSVTFFAFDWLMSLTPRFYSDIFGMVIATSFMSSAACLAMLAVSARPTDEIAGERRDLANLWLTVQCGWTFMAFSQYILIWSGNMPHEILWYLHRGNGGWQVLAWLSFVSLFALPLGVLISSRAKGSRRALMGLAVCTVAGHVVHSYWLVLPSFYHAGIQWHWMQLTAWLSMGGLAVVAFLYALDRQGRPSAVERPGYA